MTKYKYLHPRVNPIRVVQVTLNVNLGLQFSGGELAVYGVSGGLRGGDGPKIYHDWQVRFIYTYIYMYIYNGPKVYHDWQVRFIYIYVYIYVCMYIYVYMYVCIYLCVCIYIHTYKYTILTPKAASPGHLWSSNIFGATRHSTCAAAWSTHITHRAAHRPLHTHLSVAVASASRDRRLRAASASRLATIFCS